MTTPTLRTACPWCGSNRFALDAPGWNRCDNCNGEFRVNEQSEQSEQSEGIEANTDAPAEPEAGGAAR